MEKIHMSTAQIRSTNSSHQSDSPSNTGPRASAADQHAPHVDLSHINLV